jgi:predicted RecA/RadA family phage recombinase
MTNFVQAGEIMEYNNSGSAIESGDVVVIGNRVGIAIVDIAATSGVGSVLMEGVFSLSKDPDEAFSQGDDLFYDSSDDTFTKTATGNKYAGYAFEASASDATSCKVKLQPGPKQAAIVAYSAGSNLVGVDGAGSNAAPLAGTETRLDAIDTAIAALIASMKAAGLMSNS